MYVLSQGSTVHNHAIIFGITLELVPLEVERTLNLSCKFYRKCMPGTSQTYFRPTLEFMYALSLLSRE